MDYLQKVMAQISSFMKALTPMRRVAIGVLAAVILGSLAAMVMWAGEKNFSPLMSNLNPEDAANIIRVLRDKHIPFRVDDSGRNVSVPPESVDQLRLELATDGLPQTSVVGYEVFDKQSLGTTSFVQKINQKRALEGELMRTIASIKGVKRSRVHLAMPQKTTFVEDQKKSTASVVVDLEPGVVLSDKQVFGIGNLVARAVEGLDLSDVVIVDSQGKVLSKNGSDSLAQATATQLEFKQHVEQEMEGRIEAMLSRVVGDGHVVARVAADVDFSQVSETQTTYDADGTAMLSNEKTSDVADNARPGPQGIAGARSNLPDQPQPTNTGTHTQTNNSHEIVNYKVPETVRRTMKPSGQVTHLSVAVLVDGKQVRSPASESGKEGAVKNEAWPADKLKEFEDVVVSAVGIDRKRGDTIEVKNMEFTHEDFEEAQRILSEKERKSYVQNIVLYAVVGLTIVLFFLLVVRPFIKWITENTVDSVETYLPQTIEELEKLQKNAALPGLEDVVPDVPDKLDPEKMEGEMIKEKIVTLVDANPHKAALILRDWLHGAEAARKGDGKGGGGAGKSKTA